MPVETFATCALCLLAVFIMRIALCYVLEHIFKRPVPGSLKFPAWEGPVMMTQMIALSDSAFTSLGTGCAHWMVFGGVILLVGPLGFLLLAMSRIRQHMRTGDLSFEVRCVLNLSRCKFAKFQCFSRFNDART